MLGLSGGGIRATALSYFVLKELAVMHYPCGEDHCRLIDDVKIISSVSGGSVTAAYFALYGADRLDRLRDTFLMQDNNRRMVLAALQPYRLGKLLFGAYSRSSVLVDYLDQTLFRGATLGNLRDTDRPLLILNATDIVDGTTFFFSPSLFNALCSEYESYRLAAGVAASAAFPIAFTPLTLKNYSGPSCPGWDKTDSYVEFVNDNYIDRVLRYLNSLYRGVDAERAIDYLHLIDGGLSDNLALSPLEAMIRRPTVLGFRNSIDSSFPAKPVTRRGLTVIAVNARVTQQTSLDSREPPPTVGDVVRSVIDLPMSSSSTRTQESIEGLMQQVNRQFSVEDQNWYDPRAKSVWFFRIDLNDLYGLCTAEFNRAINDIPTSWTISAKQLHLLNIAARRLMVQAAAEFSLDRHLVAPPLDRETLRVCSSHDVR